MSSSHQTAYLIDDDEAMRNSIAHALTKREIPARTFPSATVFLDAYQKTWRGCLVIDIRMPGMSGLELQTRLAEYDINMPIIFITGYGNVEKAVQAMKGGAVDFLQKPFSQQALVDCIERAFQKDTERQSEQVDQETARALFLRLTKRELEIAQIMACRPSNASSKQIARDLGVSPRTVDHHRSRIMEKVEARSLIEFIDVARRAGITGIDETDRAWWYDHVI